MHSFPLEKQVKIVIASTTLRNFKRINVRTYIKFKLYDDDQELLPPNEEGGSIHVVKEDGSCHAREMGEEHDWIAHLIISHWCLIMTLIYMKIDFSFFCCEKICLVYFLLVKFFWTN